MTDKERKFIVVDEDNKPMTFDPRSRQLCYNATLGYTRFYLELYTREQAKNAINVTRANRKKWGMEVGEYYLMPIKSNQTYDR